MLDLQGGLPRRRSTLGERGCDDSVTGCEVPDHALSIARALDDVTERVPYPLRPLEQATLVARKGHPRQATRQEGSRPSKKSCRLFSTSIPMAVRVSRVALPRCGSSTALSSSSSWAGILGSPS